MLGVIKIIDLWYLLQKVTTDKYVNIDYEKYARTLTCAHMVLTGSIWRRSRTAVLGTIMFGSWRCWWQNQLCVFISRFVNSTLKSVAFNQHVVWSADFNREFHIFFIKIQQ